MTAATPRTNHPQRVTAAGIGSTYWFGSTPRGFAFLGCSERGSSRRITTPAGVEVIQTFGGPVPAVSFLEDVIFRRPSAFSTVRPSRLRFCRCGDASECNRRRVFRVRFHARTITQRWVMSTRNRAAGVNCRPNATALPRREGASE